jgi:glycosyltransferase involved in cell wall biosynthesis
MRRSKITDADFLSSNVVKKPGRPMLVSVVIPTHNRPEMLVEAIASVRVQTLADYEIIVISNGEGTDMRRASREAAANCTYVELDRGNVSAARNAGIERANGEWVAFLDDDDIWLPTKLERQCAEAQRTGADLIACDYVDCYSDSRKIVRQPRLPDGWTYVKAACLQSWWAVPSATMIRKSVLSRVGGFDRRLCYAEDTDMVRRISWRHPIHQMEEVLVHLRHGHPSLTQRPERSRRLQTLRHSLKMYVDTPRDLRSELPPAIVIGLQLALLLAPEWLLRLGRAAYLRA